PRRRESGAESPWLALDHRLRGAHRLQYGTFNQTLPRPQPDMRRASCRRSQYAAVDLPCLPPREDSRWSFRFDSWRMASEVIDWQSQPWDDLVPRLLSLATSRLLRMTWRGQRRGHPPGAAEAADFVNDAIFKTIKGIRQWNPRASSLLEHLAGV